MKPPQPNPLECTQSAMAEMLGLSVPRIGQLVMEGVIIKGARGRVDVIQSVKNYVAKLRDKQREKIEIAGVPDLDESKARKEAAMAGLAELKLAAEKMEFIPIAEVDGRDARIAGSVRMAVLRQRAELPPQLEGLQANQIATVLDDYNRAMLDEMADVQSEFWTRREKAIEAAKQDE
jgi:phage terminase Nu1 subunit (DNA packaging protein)